jgi:hypothetical protein
METVFDFVRNVKRLPQVRVAAIPEKPWDRGGIGAFLLGALDFKEWVEDTEWNRWFIRANDIEIEEW